MKLKNGFVIDYKNNLPAELKFAKGKFNFAEVTLNSKTGNQHDIPVIGHLYWGHDITKPAPELFYFF